MPQVYTKASERFSFTRTQPVMPACKQEDCPKASSLSHPAKMSCLCSPTTHAGSFRCRLHRAPAKASTKSLVSQSQHSKDDTRAFATNSSASKNKRLAKLMSRLSVTDDSTKSTRSFPKPPSRYYSSNKVRTPSRLSKVIFARDIKEEEDTFAQQETPSSSLQQPRPSGQIAPPQSKPSSFRLVALRKCHRELGEGLLRLKGPRSAYAAPIFSR